MAQGFLGLVSLFGLGMISVIKFRSQPLSGLGEADVLGPPRPIACDSFSSETA